MTIQDQIEMKEIHVRKLKAEIEELKQESPFRKWENHDPFHLLNPQSWVCRKKGWNACVDHLRTRCLDTEGNFLGTYSGNFIREILVVAKEE